MTARILAVVGAGTGVGKTAVTRHLRDAFRDVGVAADCVKPYVSGRSSPGTWPDLEYLQCEAAARYIRPLAPLAAVRAGETQTAPDAVLDFVHAHAHRLRDGWLLVEGIGGVMVPLATGVTWLDWHAEAGWPAIVVGAAGLGTINHMLLTLEALRTRGIPVAGFVLSEIEPTSLGVAEANALLIAEFSGVVPLGVLRYDASTGVLGRWDGAAGERLVKQLEEILG